jgi:hypothetical protein
MLPAEENCKRSIRRHRPQVPSPSSLQQLTIPPEFAATLGVDRAFSFMLLQSLVRLTDDSSGEWFCG